MHAISHFYFFLRRLELIIQRRILVLDSTVVSVCVNHGEWFDSFYSRMTKHGYASSRSKCQRLNWKLRTGTHTISRHRWNTKEEWLSAFHLCRFVSADCGEMNGLYGPHRHLPTSAHPHPVYVCSRRLLRRSVKRSLVRSARNPLSPAQMQLSYVCSAGHCLWIQPSILETCSFV